MYYLDNIRGQNGAAIYKTKGSFNYPLQKNKGGGYKIQSGELIRLCMTSDFFLEEADAWRDDVWDMIRQRSDVKFLLLTKRPERIAACLPKDWGDGYENVFLNVTCENQARADERMPILLSIPAKHKGVMCAPFIGPVSLAPYLASGQIERVVCGGENYGGNRPCNFAWVLALRAECVAANITFCFIETGTYFIKDDKMYQIKKKQTQSEMAVKAGVFYQGKPVHYKLTGAFNLPLDGGDLYCPTFKPRCQTCGRKPICNGCSNCGKCL